MFERMLDHPLDRGPLGTDFDEVADALATATSSAPGPIDDFFDIGFGRLPYRSLRFEFETLAGRTLPAGRGGQLPRRARAVHAHHASSSTSPARSSRRPDRPRVPADEGDPYYPIPRPENAELYTALRVLAEATPDVHFVGRLATYKYYNMDQVVAQALSTFRKIQDEETRAA